MAINGVRRSAPSDGNAANGVSDDGPTLKKAKLSADGPGAFGAFANESVLLDTAPTLHKQFAASEPYLHAVAQDLFNDALLRDVRKEIYDHLEFTLKETDIYRVS